MLTPLSDRLVSSLRTIAGPELQKLTFRLAPVIVLSLSVYWLAPRFSFRDVASLSFAHNNRCGSSLRTSRLL